LVALKAHVTYINIKALLQDLQGKPQTTTIIHVDNQGAKAIGENPVTYERSKHISIKYHYTREKILNETVSLQYIHTKKNIADCLTKTMAKQTLQDAYPSHPE
jgi:hypothetical protein